MSGEFWAYYNREGKGAKKRYICNFCNHKLPTLSGITSHLSRSHDEEIEEYERKARKWKENQQRKRQEEIQQRRVEKEFAEQQLKEYERILPQIKLQNKLKKEAEQKRIQEETEAEQKRIQEEKVEEEHRRREEARMTEVWNKAQKETQKQEVRRRHKENTRKIFAYYLIFKKENPTLQDFYLSSL